MSCTPKTSVIFYVNYTSITLQTKITELKQKKFGDIKAEFHARMGTIKDRNGKDLIEAEEIKKKWQKYIEELYQKKVFMNWITTITWSLM